MRFPRVRCTQPIFDAYVFCDWSASSVPKSGRDSIWVCRGRYRESGSLRWELHNLRTRADAATLVLGWLREGVRSKARTLVGFDFPYGLPVQAYARIGAPRGWRDYWRKLAATIVDGPRNENNRFEVARALNRRCRLASGGPFWGAPPSAVSGDLTATKPRGKSRLPELREVELMLRAKGRRPFSAWQLLGNGSVGSQALVGIPVLERLRADPELRACSRVWPFEDGWDDPVRPRIVHAEVWPSMIAFDPTLHEVRDAAQVIGLTAWTAREDCAGRLVAHLDAYRANAAREELARAEGWVVGVA